MMKGSISFIRLICDKLIFMSYRSCHVLIYIIIRYYRLSLHHVSVKGKFMESEISLWVPGWMIATEHVESVGLVVFSEVRFWWLLCNSISLNFN